MKRQKHVTVDWAHWSWLSRDIGRQLHCLSIKRWFRAKSKHQKIISLDELKASGLSSGPYEFLFSFYCIFFSQSAIVFFRPDSSFLPHRSVQLDRRTSEESEFSSLQRCFVCRRKLSFMIVIFRFFLYSYLSLSHLKHQLRNGESLRYLQDGLFIDEIRAKSFEIVALSSIAVLSSIAE